MGFSKSASFRTSKLLCAKGFKLNCSVDRDMDVSTSALVDVDVAECLSGLCCASVFVVIQDAVLLFLVGYMLILAVCLQKRG